MSDNRQLVSDIRELDKGITECEKVLAKVLNRKAAETSRQPSVTKRRNVSSKSVSRPQSRGTSATHQRAPSVGAGSGVRDTKPISAAPMRNARKSSPEPLLQKSSRNSDGARRRSSSVSRMAPRDGRCRCEASSKPPNKAHQAHVPNARVSQEVPRPQTPETVCNRNMSWGEILRSTAARGPSRGQWDIGGANARSYTAQQKQAFTTKLPHDCVPMKESSSQSSECTTGRFIPKTRTTEESFSSEGTSGFSSNNELPSNKTSKGIQCGSAMRSSSSAQDDQQRVSSSSSGASSQKDEKEKVSGVLGNDVFSLFNPVRTLHFLIRELHGKLQKYPQADGGTCLCIVADMERALGRLPESGGSFHSQSPCDDRQCAAAMAHALSAVPALAKRIDCRVQAMRTKILESKTPIPVPSFAPSPVQASVDDILQLQRHVETSGHQLEVMCQAMEQVCDALRKERDAQRGEIEERDKKLQIIKSQEQDLMTTVSSLKSNLETTNARATQLAAENKLLKEQMQLLPAFQESEIKLKAVTAELNALREELKELPVLRVAHAELKIVSEKMRRLEEANLELPGLKYIEAKYKQLAVENAKLKEENKIIPTLKANEIKIADLTAELSRVKLEKKSQSCQVGVAEAVKRLTERLQDVMRERDEAQHQLQVLRLEKEKLVVLSQSKDQELQRFVSDIINIKQIVANQLDFLKSFVPKWTPPEAMSDVLSLSMDSDDMTSVSHCQPVCSSPTSTTSGIVPAADDSVWQDVSTIAPEHTQSSPEVLMRASPPSNANTTTFQSIDPVTSWHNLPPAGANMLAQELQQNVQELFRFISEGSKTASTSSACQAVSAPSSKLLPHGGRRGARSIGLKLPDPPKFLEVPEFSDFSSYHGSLAGSTSMESIDAVLKELQKCD